MLANSTGQCRNNTILFPFGGHVFLLNFQATLSSFGQGDRQLPSRGTDAKRSRYQAALSVGTIPPLAPTLNELPILLYYYERRVGATARVARCR